MNDTITIQRDTWDEAIFKIKQLERQVNELIAVAEYRVGHIYNGECPDESQPGANDKNCPACQVIQKAKQAMGGA